MMRWLKRGILRVVNSLGPVVIPPLMRWLADGSKEFDPPGPAGPPAGMPPPHAAPDGYTAPEGSPITVWLLSEAMARNAVRLDQQRDLNAAMETLRLDAFRQPLMLMYASLMMHSGYPIDEIFIRVFANVLVLGFVAGQIEGAGPAFFDSMRPGEVPPGNPRPISDLAGLGPIASVHIFDKGKGADDAGTD